MVEKNAGAQPVRGASMNVPIHCFKQGGNNSLREPRFFQKSEGRVCGGALQQGGRQLAGRACSSGVGREDLHARVPVFGVRVEDA